MAEFKIAILSLVLLVIASVEANNRHKRQAWGGTGPSFRITDGVPVDHQSPPSKQDPPPPPPPSSPKGQQNPWMTGSGTGNSGLDLMNMMGGGMNNFGGGQNRGMGSGTGRGTLAALRRQLMMGIGVDTPDHKKNFNPAPVELLHYGCPHELPVQQCVVNPCPIRCKRFPMAKCYTNACGGCAPEWIQNGMKIIDCD
ncbi:uncharacterized protein LOC127732580 isoform X3 [Mytilus californianus]|uniref:uncharacterized protein LOC127732580 isoform X3 n=1 Tax=Mytilus californianus TaxID=6549 RepID=UPI0022477CE4|nr:uncharacterized protein LOC127732580 isoform X3 [Mytilus californianus]